MQMHPGCVAQDIVFLHYIGMVLEELFGLHALSRSLDHSAMMCYELKESALAVDAQCLSTSNSVYYPARNNYMQCKGMLELGEKLIAHRKQMQSKLSLAWQVFGYEKVAARSERNYITTT
eukprot:52202-Amphidinium_carterae.1